MTFHYTYIILLLICMLMTPLYTYISVSNLETILQKDLNRLLEWCYINKMNLNTPKN